MKFLETCIGLAFVFLKNTTSIYRFFCFYTLILGLFVKLVLVLDYETATPFVSGVTMRIKTFFRNILLVVIAHCPISTT